MITAIFIITTIYLGAINYTYRKNLKEAEVLIEDYQDKLDKKGDNFYD